MKVTLCCTGAALAMIASIVSSVTDHPVIAMILTAVVLALLWKACRDMEKEENNNRTTKYWGK